MTNKYFPRLIEELIKMNEARSHRKRNVKMSEVIEAAKTQVEDYLKSWLENAVDLIGPLEFSVGQTSKVPHVETNLLFRKQLQSITSVDFLTHVTDTIKSLGQALGDIHQDVKYYETMCKHHVELTEHMTNEFKQFQSNYNITKNELRDLQDDSVNQIQNYKKQVVTKAQQSARRIMKDNKFDNKQNTISSLISLGVNDDNLDKRISGGNISSRSTTVNYVPPASKRVRRR